MEARHNHPLSHLATSRILHDWHELGSFGVVERRSPCILPERR